MGLKSYLKEQFQLSMFGLDHHTVTDFYLSPWQKNRNSLPLLIFRTLLFLCSIFTFVISFVLVDTGSGYLSYWLIYLTNWGLIALLLTTGFSAGVSAKFYFFRSTDVSLGLPWHVKVYWLLVNITTPLAFVITILYYSFLYSQVTPDSELVDVMSHGVNSVVMFLLLATSRTPCRLLHMYQPLALVLIYNVFSLIYYFAGGVDPSGEPWIYPMMNWAEVGPTLIFLALSIVIFIVIYCVVCIMVEIRDFFSSSLRKSSDKLTVSQEP